MHCLDHIKALWSMSKSAIDMGVYKTNNAPYILKPFMP